MGFRDLKLDTHKNWPSHAERLCSHPVTKTEIGDKDLKPVDRGNNHMQCLPYLPACTTLTHNAGIAPFCGE